MNPNQQQSQTSKYILQDRLTQSQINQLNGLKDLVQTFMNKQHKKLVTFLTSGGTSVPLQKNTVRFIQNFSTGLRGSKIAQAILQSGSSSLIYFYRDKSFLPYQNGITINQAILGQSDDKINQILKGRQKLKKRIQQNEILLIPYSSIYMYLNGIIQIKKYLWKHSIIILCAAVSDFIPKQLAQHKITTSQYLQLRLENSPKILGKVSQNNFHLTMSFKLQTDHNKLDDRIQFAINKYGVDMVVGNVLGNKNWVKIQYNQNRFPQQKPIQYQQNIQGNIWKQALLAYYKLFAQKNLIL